MCEVKGAHIMGKRPDILEDFSREDAILIGTIASLLICDINC